MAAIRLKRADDERGAGLMDAARAAASLRGGRGSVRAGIGTRLARRLALPGCLKGARAKYRFEDNGHAA